LDGSEKTGTRYAPRTSLAVRTVARSLKLSLVKTTPLPSVTQEGQPQQYIFALHPHAILPLGGVTNLTSDITGFSDLFPVRVNHPCRFEGGSRLSSLEQKQ
jgi:hypothetical protein